MRIILALLLGLVVGAGGVLLYGTTQGKSALRSTGNQIDSAARSARDMLQEKLGLLELRPEEVKEDLSRTGQVIRNKTREVRDAVVDGTADARMTGAIKTRLLAHKDLSSLGISVNTTAGVVTMSGSVNSTEEISKAMLVAMETEGVRKVISTLQVRPKAVAKSN